jgi:hypothetical protein
MKNVSNVFLSLITTFVPITMEFIKGQEESLYVVYYCKNNWCHQNYFQHARNGIAALQYG